MKKQFKNRTPADMFATVAKRGASKKKTVVKKKAKMSVADKFGLYK